MQERFTASTQYNDWTGSSAADDADRNRIRGWATREGYVGENEFLLGVKMVIGENHGTHADPVIVELICVERGDQDTVQAMIDAAEDGPISVKRKTVEMPIAEFLGFFKRMEIALSAHSMLDAKDYSYPEE